MTLKTRFYEQYGNAYVQYFINDRKVGESSIQEYVKINVWHMLEQMGFNIGNIDKVDLDPLTDEYCEKYVRSNGYFVAL